MKIIYLFFIFLLINNVYGFGVSPGSIDVELKNGEETEKEFFIVNGDEAKTFNISSEFGFLNFSNLITEVHGEDKISFLVKAPYEAQNGEYEGRIYVKEVEKEEGGVDLDTLLGIKIKVHVSSDFVSQTEDNLVTERGEEREYERSTEKDTTSIMEYLKEPELVLFYALIAFILMLCFFVIAIKIFSKEV